MRRDILAFWGKLGRGKYPEDCHPAVCHLLDVGNCCRALWRQALGDNSRARWSSSLGIDESCAERWIAFWAAAHDIGKITPCFQYKSLEAKNKMKSPEFPATERTLPHALLSAIYLRTELAAPTANAFPAVSKSLASSIAQVLGGHHGRIPGSGDLRESSRVLGTGAWVAARAEIMKFLAEEFEVVGITPPHSLTQADRSFWLFLSGLIAVADWIGSNATFFQTNGAWCGTNIDPELYRIQSRASADRAVYELGFGRWEPQTTGALSFGEVHPDITNPRPLQQACVEIAATATGPQLVLIEAPMGEGKTEAAVYLADQATHVLGCRGLYIALPTQATSNQMFGRIRKWLTQRYDMEGNSQRLNLQLLHGQTGFSEAFSQLLKLADIDDPQTESNPASGKPKAHVVAESWFAQNRKQQLLAPFGVGTIDQILLAVLQTKHHFVRLFGLAGRTVILDEVHAYDAYMTTLMERLLAWLAGLGCPVVLLSATLPSARRQKLIEAYTGCSPQIANDAYPRITVAQHGKADVLSRHFEADASRRLTIQTTWVVEQDLLDRLEHILSDGGCVGIICNTVERAQKLFQWLAGHFKSNDIAVRLFHARFTVADRLRIENQVLASLGPPLQNSLRPKTSILVATQVIEQSLDLDFDLLISEVAPIDLLLQRAGRLHRHHGRSRPASLRRPQLWLFQPEQNRDGIPDFGPFQSNVSEKGEYRDGVYDRSVLLRTWLTLRNPGSRDHAITLPDDLERLIEAVYSPDGTKSLGTAWDAEITRTSTARELSIRTSELKAASVRIPQPRSDSLLESNNLELEEDDNGIHRELQALTRESEPSLTLVFLYRNGELISLDAEARSPIELESSPSPRLTRQLLERSVSISNKFWVRHFRSTSIPDSWQKNAALCRLRPVMLNAAGGFTAGTRQLRLDTQLGVVFEYE